MSAVIYWRASTGESNEIELVKIHEELVGLHIYFASREEAVDYRLSLLRKHLSDAEQELESRRANLAAFKEIC